MNLSPDKVLAHMAVLGRVTPSSTTAIVLGKHTAEEIKAQGEVEAWHKSILSNDERIQRHISGVTLGDLARGIQRHSVVVEAAKKEIREYLVKNNKFNISEEVIDRYVEAQGEIYHLMIQTMAEKISSILSQFS